MKFTNFFRRGKKATGEDSEISSGKAHEKIQSASTFEGYEDLEKLLNGSEDKETLHAIGDHLNRISENYEKKGFEDGKRNVRDNQIQLSAESLATEIHQHILAYLLKKKTQLETQREQISQKRNNTIEKYKNCERTYQKLQEKESSEQGSKKFNAVSEVMYLFFGVMLLVADIPLSMNIVDSFRIVQTEDLQFWDKFWTPDIILFALGISFCAIYVKTLFDEYILSPDGHWFDQITDDTSFRHKSRLYAERILKLLVKLSVLTIIVVMLFHVGNVRAELVENNKNKESVRIGFFLISIIIPIVSGVCLSLGASIFKNINTLKKLRIRTGELEEEILKLSNELSIINGRHEYYQSPSKFWEEKTKKIENLRNLFVSRYIVGYKQAQQVYFGLDIIKEIEHLYLDQIHLKKI